jgi:hypothetical protein
MIEMIEQIHLKRTDHSTSQVQLLQCTQFHFRTAVGSQTAQGTPLTRHVHLSQKFYLSTFRIRSLCNGYGSPRIRHGRSHHRSDRSGVIRRQTVHLPQVSNNLIYSKGYCPDCQLKMNLHYCLRV